MPDIVGQRLRTEHNGAFQVYELVAAGAFGSVYFGRDLETNRAVAIKRLHPHWARDPRAVERFSQEAQTGRELKHPNVVQLLDQGSDADGIPFIVMQWVEGWTVAALFERHVTQLGAFPIDEAVEIAWQTLDGLEAARRIGLVHRDIKPLNLMVTPPPERQVKVMDFGIAKDVLAAVTGDNTQVGTLAYMAPEQFTGAAVDTRTDLYALGVTLYELLAGQRPFLGPTPAAYVRQHLYEVPRPLRELRPAVDAALAEVVHRALARRPEDRFQLPTEMQAALRPVNGPAPKLTLPAGAAESLYAQGVARATAEDPLREPQDPLREPQDPLREPHGSLREPQDLTRASGPIEQTGLRRPVDGDEITRMSGAGAHIDQQEQPPTSRRGRRTVAVATGVVVVGVVLAGLVWSPWRSVSPGVLTPTTLPAATLPPLIAPTTAPIADLATRSVGKPTAAATVAAPIARPTAPLPPANWQVIVDGMAQLNGVSVDEHGNIYVANSESNRVQKLSAAGQLLFEWGSDWGPHPGQFEAPQDVAVDAQGNVYVADRDNNRIQKLSATGQPLAQWGALGTGPGEFAGPMALVLDAQGSLYITDSGNNRVQKLSAAGEPVAQWGASGNGPGQFSNPTGVALDGQGNVYVADSNNNRVQKLSAAGQPLAQWGTGGTGPGQFSNPTGVAIDGQGSIYVTDRANGRVQKLSAAGQPLAQWGTYGSGSGPGQFSNPFGVAVDAHGNVYVVDRDHNRIQELPGTN